MPPNPRLTALRNTLLVLVDVGEQVDEQHGEADASADALSWRELAIGCTRQASLRQLQRDYLVRWNEGVGAAVEDFWREVASRHLDVARKQDIVLDTLRRGRVLNPQHFDELEDHFEELQTCHKITPDEAYTLNELLDRFEANPKNFDEVRSRF